METKTTFDHGFWPVSLDQVTPADLTRGSYRIQAFFTCYSERGRHAVPLMVHHGPVVVLRMLPVPQLGLPVHLGDQTAHFQRTVARHGGGGGCSGHRRRVFV